MASTAKQAPGHICQGSSGDAGEGKKSRPLFCEETIFGVHITVLSHNTNGGGSSSHSCPMVIDCLDQRAAPSCLKALLDWNGSCFSRMTSRGSSCPKAMMVFPCFKNIQEQIFCSLSILAAGKCL